ncbi:MAG: response regulator transcription factor [Pirellulaceae bacterium]
MDVRMLIVDDHPTVRESLRFVFAAAGIEKIMEATTCHDTIEAVRQLPLDLVLLDVALSDGSGLDALREIKSIDAALPVLVHSYHDNPRLLSQSFHAGAVGYVVKGEDKNSLIHAARQAASGGSVWTAEQMDQIRTVDAELGEESLVARRPTTTGVAHLTA